MQTVLQKKPSSSNSGSGKGSADTQPFHPICSNPGTVVAATAAAREVVGRLERWRGRTFLSDGTPRGIETGALSRPPGPDIQGVTGSTSQSRINKAPAFWQRTKRGSPPKVKGTETIMAREELGNDPMEILMNCWAHSWACVTLTLKSIQSTLKTGLWYKALPSSHTGH